MYHGTIKEVPILVLRQVDDFAIAAPDETHANHIIDAIDENLICSLKHLGILTNFNSSDLLQSRHFVSLTCTSYLKRVLKRHGWETLNNKPPDRRCIPRNPDSTIMYTLEQTKGSTDLEEISVLESTMGFSYKAAIGELIFAMIVCYPDISFATIKLSQYSVAPAKCHFIEVKNVFRYLLATVHEGLTYWRISPHDSLPEHPFPDPVTPPHEWDLLLKHNLDFSAIGYTDSDWASDVSHRRSVSAWLYILAGAVVLYKTRFQDAVALSTTEAEFVSTSDAGKSGIYVRTILDELRLSQLSPTVIYVDNKGAYNIAQQGQPTKNSKHIDIRHFAIQDWVEKDLISLESVKTTSNVSDSLSKATQKQLFHRHFDFIMGKIPHHNI